MAELVEVRVPDIGDFADVPVIEILVAPGDAVAVEDPLVTLESDKATMDIPSPAAGTVRELRISVGDRVTVGQPILLLDQSDGAAPVEQLAAETVDQDEPTEALTEHARRSAEAASPPPAPGGPPVSATAAAPDFAGVHAGPSVRRLARELDVDLTTVAGSGPKGRITKDDLLREVRGPQPAAAAGGGIPEIPPQDFSKFGPVETLPLSRIQRVSGPHLHRSWLNVPHVTHDDEADITELDAYRRELDTEARADGFRVTLLSFLLKASVSALREFPRFNSSL